MNSGDNDFGAIKNLFIPNTTIIPVLGSLLFYYDNNLKSILSEKEFFEKIKKWYWCAVLSGDYSGSSDSTMARAYREMLDWFQDDDKTPERVKKVTSVYIDQTLNLENVNSIRNSFFNI